MRRNIKNPFPNILGKKKVIAVSEEKGRKRIKTRKKLIAENKKGTGGKGREGAYVNSLREGMDQIPGSLTSLI